MNKYVLAILSIFVPAIVLAAPAGQYNSSTGTKDYCAKFRSTDGTVSNDLCKDVRISEGAFSKVGSGTDAYYLIRAGLSSGGATTMTSAETAISTSYSLVDKIIASDPAFQNGTLADGTPGQVLTIRITAKDSSDATFTLTPSTTTGFTSLIFEAVGDLVTLLYVDDTVGWIVISQGSVQMVE